MSGVCTPTSPRMSLTKQYLLGGVYGVGVPLVHLLTPVSTQLFRPYQVSCRHTFFWDQEHVCICARTKTVTQHDLRCCNTMCCQDMTTLVVGTEAKASSDIVPDQHTGGEVTMSTHQGRWAYLRLLHCQCHAKWMSY